MRTPVPPAPVDTLVGDSLEAGRVFDATGSPADPTTIRTLTEGYLLLFGPA